jgi:hypothetical protein
MSGGKQPRLDEVKAAQTELDAKELISSKEVPGKRS